MRRSYYFTVRIPPRDRIWFIRLKRFEGVNIDVLCLRALKKEFNERTRKAKSPQPASDISNGSKQIPISEQ